MRLVTAVLSHWLTSDHKRAVLAQCNVAIEHYRGILVLVRQKLGLPAEGLARNLFELAITTIYLAKHEELLDDFTDYGTKIHYDVLSATLPKLLAQNKSLVYELQLRKREHQQLDVHFGAKSWHRRRIREIAEETGFAPLYKTFYKAASSIAHGDSFILIRRRHLRLWTLEINPEQWDAYIEVAARFSYLMMANLFEQVNVSLQLGHDQEMIALQAYIKTHPEYEIPVELQ